MLKLFIAIIQKTLTTSDFAFVHLPSVFGGVNSVFQKCLTFISVHVGVATVVYLATSEMKVVHCKHYNVNANKHKHLTSWVGWGSNRTIPNRLAIS